ncbi:MAG TPA: ABC transporter permease, partial [Gemmatimonadaceae bacterium]
MSGLLRDLQYALRRLRTRLGFTLIAVISLGLGIGVNTAAFSLIDAVILRKTPIDHSERVAELDLIDHGQLSGPLSYADLKDLRDEGAGVFSQMSIEQFSMFPRDVGDHVESLTGELVNGDYFPLIGLEPTVGRLLGAEDDVARGAHPVVVLGYNYWMSDFGGRRDVVGRELRLGGRAYTIVGVAPKAIEGLLPGLLPKVYAPIQMINDLQPGTNDQLTARGNHSAFAKVRLAHGQSFAAASAVVSRFVSDMQRLHPDHWPPSVTVRVIPLSQIAVSPLVDSIVVPAAAALMVVVGLVLIIACANLASFLLAQARDRRREIAVRLAIGATRRALMQQLLVESLVVALAGGALGIILSRLALHVLLTADLPIPLPLNLDVAIDLPVLSFVIATTIAAGVLFGLVPALQATRPDVVETLKSENTGGDGKRRFTMRSGLVVAQTAASLVLLVTAALFLRSFAAQS